MENANTYLIISGIVVTAAADGIVAAVGRLQRTDAIATADDNVANHYVRRHRSELLLLLLGCGCGVAVVVVVVAIGWRAFVVENIATTTKLWLLTRGHLIVISWAVGATTTTTTTATRHATGGDEIVGVVGAPVHIHRTHWALLTFEANLGAHRWHSTQMSVRMLLL